MSISTNSGSDGLFYLLIGGPFLLVWGLRLVHKKRFIENTPTSKVRSAAMGLVELAGIARPRKAQKAPISKMDCCWWDCQVQEWQSSGKNSRWVTIKSTSSIDLFYLDDVTGMVLINPLGAELHVSSVPYELNASTRTAMAPMLQNWGIDDMRWFGGQRRLRVLERVIPNCAPLFVMGDLMTTRTHLGDRQTRLMARLRQVKASSSAMAEADTDKNGTVDGEEWDIFRTKQEELFLKEELARSAQNPTEETMLVKAPLDRPFVISTRSETDLLGSIRWLAPLSLIGGIALSAGGVWLSLANGWQPVYIVGLVAIGLGAGIFSKIFKFNIGGFQS